MQARISADCKLHRESRTRRENNTFLGVFTIAHLRTASGTEAVGRKPEDTTESRRLLTQGGEPGSINQPRAGGNQRVPLSAE